MKKEMDIFSKYWLFVNYKIKSNYVENQIIPTFVSWVIQLFGIQTFQTVLTFLLPIPCPITEFSTYAKQYTDQYIFLKLQTWSIHILQLMLVQQRNIKLSGIIQMNSKTSLYILGIFMLSCIFLVIVENLLTVDLKRLHARHAGLETNLHFSNNHHLWIPWHVKEIFYLASKKAIQRKIS